MGVLYILVKGEWTGFWGSEMFGLDLLTIIIAYLYLNHSQTGSIIFAFGLGLLIDLFAGGMQGLYTLLYLSVFGSIYVACRFIHLQGTRGQIVTISLAVLFKKTLFLLLLTAFLEKTVISSVLFWTLLASAIGTGLVTPVVFHLLDRLRNSLIWSPKRQPR